LAIRLNERWHSRLPNFTSPPERCIAFGAEHDGLFYATAIWSPPLARMLNDTGRFELRRFAIADDAPRNTATRMLRVMGALLRKIRPDIRTLISYQDTSVHAGTIYKAAGWLPIAATSGQREWACKSRYARPVQSDSNKMRWEKRIA
jgi:hypothetical protein